MTIYNVKVNNQDLWVDWVGGDDTATNLLEEEN